LIELDDSEDENGGRNKDKSEGNKKAKESVKLEAKATDLSKKIEEMVKSKEVYMEKALQVKMVMAERKIPLTKLDGMQSGRMTTARPPWWREDSH
jgi:hypothetical protein